MSHPLRFRFERLSGALVVLALTAGSLRAAVIHVDSRLGDDRRDGTNAEVVSYLSGPVRTLRRAVQLVQSGDTISLVNNGTPYYESVTMTGERCSGSDVDPFVLEGNGAVLSGARWIESDAWQLVGADTWRVTPIRKGYYQLIRSGEALPEVPAPRQENAPPPLSPGEWCAWRGAIYLKVGLNESPGEMDLSLAGEAVGLTLLDVHDVVIRNVVLEHYRLDGLNAHDRCRNVIIDGVTSRQNGRSGLTVAGSCQVAIFNSRFQHNRVYSLLATERSAAYWEDCELDREPTQIEVVRD